MLYRGISYMQINTHTNKHMYTNTYTHTRAHTQAYIIRICTKYSSRKEVTT